MSETLVLSIVASVCFLAVVALLCVLFVAVMPRAQGWDVMNPPLDSEYRRFLAELDLLTAAQPFACEGCGRKLSGLPTERKAMRATDWQD